MRKWWILIGVIVVIGVMSIGSAIFSASVVLAGRTTSQGPAVLKLVNPSTGPSQKDSETKSLIYNFKINKISENDDIYKLDKPVAVVPTNTPIDKYGVTVFKRDGQTYDHPVRLANHAILFINSYKMTKNPAYLEKAKLQTQRLYDIAVKENNALFFPYKFDVYLHNIKSEHLQPLWYSGMAQGQALSAFSRLYEVTKDKKYLLWAQQTFNSFTQVRTGNSQPKMWVSLVDDQDYLWFEEYPLDKPTHVLNGFIFAIEGVYQYYEVSNDPLVKKYLEATLTTVYDHVYQYRVPGGPSRYGLKLLNQSEHYHFVHMQQLQYLYKLTGEKYFLQVRDVFHNDFNENSKKNAKKLSPTRTLAHQLKQRVKKETSSLGLEL